MKIRTELAATQFETRDIVQIAMRINVEAGSIHAWIFLKQNGFRDEEIMNLLRHTPSLHVVH
ncbi:hypothetical protein ACN9MZ_06855 [Pseudoduganella sp. S-14]|jgi:hypothetical protein|uniref:hypothetical protein n=1 Tax=Pseudoduganella sp. S-14 TaxID=3404065 RepID=UPI003CE850E6